jgi:hypothetical protein
VDASRLICQLEIGVYISRRGWISTRAASALRSLRSALMKDSAWNCSGISGMRLRLRKYYTLGTARLDDPHRAIKCRRQVGIRRGRRPFHGRQIFQILWTHAMLLVAFRRRELRVQYGLIYVYIYIYISNINKYLITSRYRNYSAIPPLSGPRFFSDSVLRVREQRMCIRFTL